METSTTLKLNPVQAVHAKPKAVYGPKKVVILEQGNLSLVGASLSQDYVLGGHIDADPLNTTFSPVSEHPDITIAGSKIEGSIFIGHYPGLKAVAPDADAPTNLLNSQFVLVEGSGYRFQIVPSIPEAPTVYNPDVVGKGPNLKKADLQKANLAGSDFTGCNLEGANFSGANLKGCDFTGANLANAKFTEANLSEAKLVGANLSEADFSGAVTSETTDFSYAYLVKALFSSLGGSSHAYLGCFKGAVFADGENRLEAANANFKKVTGLVDGQFYCYYKADVSVPAGIQATTTNKYNASRTAS